MEKILISACLLGEIVRYNAKKIELIHPKLAKWYEEGRLVTVCPEVEGGLPVPRPPAEIEGGDGASVLADYAKVVTKEGEDLTTPFVKGARVALRTARRNRIRIAILKENSPSCGWRFIYDGSFNGTKRQGSGVTATLLDNNRIKVFNEFQIDEAAKYLRKLENEKQ